MAANRMGAGRRLAAAVACAVVIGGGARADWCAVDMWDNGNVAGGTYVFPNWQQVYAASADVYLCLAAWCGAGNPENLQSLTVVNFGSAKAGTDICAVYFKASCGATSTGLLAMTSAGMYSVDAGTLPAWTWNGTSPDFSGCADLCVSPPCGGYYTIDVYADICPCPTNLATVQLGFPVRTSSTWSFEGSVSDQWGCDMPYYEIMPQQPDTIVWTLKEGPPSAAPGDTVQFTVYYGRPGTASLSDVTILDTLPPYTHFVPGGTPAPDVGWDPDFGPPTRLRWTIPPPLPTGGGPTGAVTFNVSVDWGNGEAFEPGSGDVAAPEGQRLMNAAQVFFDAASCGAKTMVTQPVTTIVRRFLWWMLGDNDLLFSTALGQPADEMTYSTFIKNASTTKTWWAVHVWDTVPAELDVWCANCGLDDPCAGWTMTPTGCAAGTPGIRVAGSQTLLTWQLDMPPQMTIELRWKAQVKGAVVGGATATNIVGLLEYGRTGIVDGTGHSGVVRRFTHLAPIVLPTTYVSYVGYETEDSGGNCPGFYIDFFPLNKKTQFELRGIQYQGPAPSWAAVGGVSESIGCLLGDCLGGFPGSAGCPLGSGGIFGGGLAGCKVERIPALYDPPGWQGVCPLSPWNFIYKLTANSPLLWQLLTHLTNCNQDFHTYTPASTLTYRGFMHYTWRGEQNISIQSLVMMNTGMDPSNVVAPSTPTTVHLFRYDYGTLSWDYITTYDLDAESAATNVSTSPADFAPWRIMSSDAAVINDMAASTFSTCGCCCCGCGDNHGALAPTRETGYAVAKPGVFPATFYGVTEPKACALQGLAIVGNVGTADAKYELYVYTPNNTIAGPAVIPPLLRDTGGTWAPAGIFTVVQGLAAAGNPDIFSAAPFNRGGNNIFKAELLSGGPIQIFTGVKPWSVWAGGAVIHAADGQPTGYTFWMHHTSGETGFGGYKPPYQTYGVTLFSSKVGMGVRGISEDGYSATYTTTGPDQAVAFLAVTNPAGKRNWKYDVIPGPTAGRVIAIYSQATATEKGYTAPFLVMGTHYEIIAPPVVFVGQSFWITVVVLDSSNSTKLDYCGTTSFTSTDPGAKIEGAPMDTYNFTWNATGICPGTSNEDGVHVFINVSMTRLGPQTIVGTDTTDGSIAGLAAIMVVATDIKLSKVQRFTVAASGDTVQFKVCWSNYSSASAFGFTITDAVPTGTTFLPESGSAGLDCGNTTGLVPAAAYSTATSPAPPASFTTGNPVAGTRWLRWTLPYAAVDATGCVCYRVTVN